MAAFTRGARSGWWVIKRNITHTIAAEKCSANFGVCVYFPPVDKMHVILEA